MKFYKRQIRPMVKPPALHGVLPKPYPVTQNNDWSDEELENVLTSVYEKIVKKQDSMNELYFDERYVKVKLPDIQPLHIQSGDVILFHFNTDELTPLELTKYVEHYQAAIPEDCQILLVPNMQTELMDKETAYKYLEKWKNDLEQL